MLDWWTSLTDIQRIFAYFAIPATVALLFQTIFLIVGLGHGDSDFEASGGHDLPDHDFDHDHGFDGHGHSFHADEHTDSGLRIFSVRTLVAFFTIFGWSGIVLTKAGLNERLSVVISIGFGFLSMLLTAYALKAMLSLQSSGNINFENCVGKTASTYIPIPPSRSGRGKVTLVVQERYTEVDAVTDDDEKIGTGAEVLVLSVTGQDAICVTSKINQR